MVCILLIPGSINAQNVPIDKDAIIHENFTRAHVDTMAQLIRAWGYRCDSVSAARPFVFSAGFSVICNNWRYDYEIEDRGGNWIVCYDECD